ncbi:substrate-binding domain-containing protein [Salinicola rhizosphaerae]|uniref:Ribose ABC transporter substrate-binding protein n=1 Tax=Salinicola rhizosphaerae TaxID=1443141 RepID=A0ABQ3EC78_9GAMM|nr:substrate-binding domain-containing protein [Salinicola rhizosphaerae]GHB31812.1 ribose ABC transporter substrate-binding protein [Salinicola rhizosphaerae]
MNRVGKGISLVVGVLASAVLMPVAVAQEGPGLEKADSYRFVVVPKVVHPWFDKVNQGAQQAAAAIEAQTGSDVEIQYSAPQSANVAEQNEIIERAIATRPDGLIVDLLDPSGNRTVLNEAQEQGIPVTLFDSINPEGMSLTTIGSDFCEQAEMAANRLIELLDGQGKVAIMMGVPTAPNHAERARCAQAVFDSHDGIEVVATGVDNDDINTAQQQASAIMQANPDLDGWVASDAAGPVGIGQAIKEADKVGKVQMVGLDDLNQMLVLIKDGVADSSSASRPTMQGYWAVMAMWQQATGAITPSHIDTGNVMITPDNVDEFME